MKTFTFLSIIILFISQACRQAPNNSTEDGIHLKFDFGNGKTEKGFTRVEAGNTYDSTSTYGFISEAPMENVNRNKGDKLEQDFFTSQKPFYFIADLPEGNYEVKVTLGDSEGTSRTTVKAESRRLMLEEVITDNGDIVTKSFMVNVRTPWINDSTKIRLKSREVNYLNWDDKLTLEFNNKKPCVAAIEIIERKDLTTIFLAGNSTVVDQEYEPWASWGQMITRFFDNEVVVANFAESGESLRSFKGRGRLKKILSLMKEGDYLFIEFGHNDQKPQSSSYVKPFEGYKEELKYFANQAREKGGIPVIISSMHRRAFDDNGEIINTHGDYPLAAMQAAEEIDAPFINLTAKSKNLYEALGVEGSKKLFVHYPANTYPGQGKALADNTHFNPYGAYQIAKCILQGINETRIGLADHIVDDFDGYDPKNPDPFEKWDLPESPFFEMIKPDGY